MVTSVVVLAGCGGGSDENGAEAEKPVTAQGAIAEIGKVRAGLADALTAYEAGDVKAADTLVGDAYLEHFELVEGPLGEQDAELNETLEDAIREELRDMITAKAPKAEVGGLVKEIQANLDKAAAALR